MKKGQRQRTYSVLLKHPTLSVVLTLTFIMDKAAPDPEATRFHYVYIVMCDDGTYYTGYTTDVERRVAEHNDGTGAKYTRGRRPVDLVHVETYDSQSAAMQREYAIKQLRRSQKEQLIRAGPADYEKG